jgi:hypothetical protein
MVPVHPQAAAHACLAAACWPTSEEVEAQSCESRSKPPIVGATGDDAVHGAA